MLNTLIELFRKTLQLLLLIAVIKVAVNYFFTGRLFSNKRQIQRQSKMSNHKQYYAYKTYKLRIRRQRIKLLKMYTKKGIHYTILGLKLTYTTINNFRLSRKKSHEVVEEVKETPIVNLEGAHAYHGNYKYTYIPDEFNKKPIS